MKLITKDTLPPGLDGRIWGEPSVLALRSTGEWSSVEIPQTGPVGKAGTGTRWYSCCQLKNINIQFHPKC